MDGRVERKINDNIYFVLDEVGGSSDVEPGQVSDDDIKIPFNDDNEEKDKSNDLYRIIERNPRHTGRNLDVKNCFAGVNSFNKTSSVNTDAHNHDEIKTSRNNCDSFVMAPSPRPTDSSPMNIKQNSDSVAIDMDCNSDPEEFYDSQKKTIDPIIKITFRDKQVEKRYRASILKYLSQKLRPCNIVSNSENNLELAVYKVESERSSDVFDFHLDATPSSDFHNSRVPNYCKNDNLFLGNMDSSETLTLSSKTQSVSCFDCSGNHMLRDCPNEKKTKTIAQNINKFQGGNKLAKNSRYHLDESQRFSNLVPGVLSKSLRNALDLKEDQLPEFIYRMRLLGYPPAWLEEARVSHSGVMIYDSKGVPILEEDEEEGEIIAEGAKDRFDINKIINFPGFNVPLPSNIKEEGNQYGCPEISEEQSKINLVRKLEPNAVQAYKKKTLTLNRSTPQNDSFSDKGTLKRPGSPTIEEMEERKRLLLQALSKEDLTSDNKLTEDENWTPSQEERNPKTRSETPVKEIVNKLSFGTPILKSISPFSKLPSREQFSVNVSDVINFENLPNATGKYEAMSNLILKIRSTISRIHKE